MRRTAAGVLAGALALSGAVAVATPANALPGFALERIAGDNRYETSARTAVAFGNSTGAILASGENNRYADALSASFLAGVRNVPVLLTQRTSTPSVVLAAMRTIGVRNVTIVGSTDVVTQAQQNALTAAGFTVTRLGGANRYDTARDVIAAGQSQAANIGIVATGENFPDALGAGPLAFKGKHPIFLVNRFGIPGSTLAALRASGIKQVIVIGGDAAVTPAVRTALTAEGVTVVTTLAGVDRSTTSARIADYLFTQAGWDKTTFNLATGVNGGVDALGGAALSGKQSRALLITNTPTSAAPVVDFARRNAATLNTTGNIFGGPAAVSVALEAEIEAAGRETPVTVTPGTGGATAAAGSNFVGTINAPGQNITSVAVSGPCVTANTNVPETGTAGGAEFGFSIPITGSTAAGNCTLTFAVTVAGQTQPITVTQVVAVTAQPSATTRPELLSAAITGTNTAAQEGADGTTVTYTFDEAVLASGAQGPVAGEFMVYDRAGAPTAASEVLATSGNTVTVRFNGINTTADAAALTVATVDPGAVTDAQGQTNPEGDAAIGTAGGGTTTQAAGITAAPDLVSVGGFRAGTATGTTAVDFVFDEAAFVADSDNFRLVLTDGSEVVGTAQAPGTPVAGVGSNVSGGGAAGGNGTTTLTVVFVNPDGPDEGTDPGQAFDPTITAARVARGTVDAGTVGDAAQTDDDNVAPGFQSSVVEGVANVAQAAPVSANGVTTGPDLVSVELRPAAAGSADQALFTFDQPVVVQGGANAPVVGSFTLYRADSTATAESAAGGSALVNPADRRQVLITFVDPNSNATVDVVGGSVADGAVTLANADGTVASPTVVNQQDEEGVANTSTDAGRTPGRTDGPDLTAVTISRQAAGPFGEQGRFQAVYTFDEDVDVVTAGEFFLLAADGTRSVAPNCSVTTATGTQTADDVDNTVTCAATTDAQSTAIGNAVLGTVDDGAVNDEDDASNVGNPEGAEFTTGGTGTRTS